MDLGVATLMLDVLVSVVMGWRDGRGYLGGRGMRGGHCVHDVRGVGGVRGCGCWRRFSDIGRGSLLFGPFELVKFTAK